MTRQRTAATKIFMNFLYHVLVPEEFQRLYNDMATEISALFGDSTYSLAAGRS